MKNRKRKGNDFEKIGELPAEQTMYPDDTTHEIFNANLKNGAFLHRFRNKAGVPYSAIYLKGYEVKNTPRELEQRMICSYQEDPYEYDL